MQLKMTRKSKWTINGRIVEFQSEQILNAPDDISERKAFEMIQHGYAVRLDSAPTFEPPLQKSVSGSPENKAFEPQYQNKDADLSRQLDEMTKKELVIYAQKKNIDVKDAKSKEELKKMIMQGGASI